LPYFWLFSAVLFLPILTTMAGESYYDSNCVSCHGDPAGASPVGAPEGGILAYLQGGVCFETEFTSKMGSHSRAVNNY
jgi:hypothetical protein